MNPLTSSGLFASKQSVNEYLKPSTGSALLLIFAVAASITGYLTIHYDPAFDVATVSRALYVDEGFYSDAAQNYTKFGSWGLPYDSRHWPGAPLLTVIQALFFSVFGVSLTVARMISILCGIVSLLCIYSIARTRLSVFVSLILAMVAVLTFNFTAHTRVAIADPMATCCSLLALTVYTRFINRYWAIPLSLFFAYMAVCSKMYFLFALITIIILWLMEVIIIPALDKRKINMHHVLLLVASLLLIALSYAALTIRFDDAFAQFLGINENKTPSLNPLVLTSQFLMSVQHLPFNTKTHISLLCLGVSFACWFYRCIGIRRFSQFREHLAGWGRSGWALSIFLLLGLCTTAALNLPNKAHYHYFSILPIICLSVFAVDALSPSRIKTRIILTLLISQLLLQTQYYYQWLDRPERMLVHTANVEMINLIDKSSNSDVISVIGQYSAQLALYSDRMVSLEVKWIPIEGLCQRLDYWRPEFFVNFLFPGRIISEGDRLAYCNILDGFVELARFNINELWNDEVILYKLVYTDK